MHQNYCMLLRSTDHFWKNQKIKKLIKIGSNIGLLFQIIDDLIDC